MTIRKKWWIIIAVFVVLGVVVGFGYDQFHKMVLASQTKSWRMNWDFNAPQAERVTNVFYNGGRDGDYYYISDYDEAATQKLTQLRIWNKVEDKGDVISTYINDYKALIIQQHQDNDRYEKLFRDHPVQFKSNSLYFTKKQADGSYIVAVLNVDERKLYTMEVFY